MKPNKCQGISAKFSVLIERAMSSEEFFIHLSAIHFQDFTRFSENRLDILEKIDYNNRDTAVLQGYALIFVSFERSVSLIMENKKRMSREGYEKLQKELDHLINVDRVEVAQKLKEASSYGDLSENAEYDEAKNEQAILEAKIKEVQYTLDHAEIVEHTGNDEIDIGVTITIRKVGTEKDEKWKLVGTNEANFLEHKISDESPIGKSAIGKKVGDIFLVETPRGEAEYEVIKIERD